MNKENSKTEEIINESNNIENFCNNDKIESINNEPFIQHKGKEKELSFLLNKTMNQKSLK
jgi:hypothetical protein